MTNGRHESVLLAELFAQTDFLRIVATLTGIFPALTLSKLFLDQGFKSVGEREISKSAAALTGREAGSELKLAA